MVTISILPIQKYCNIEKIPTDIAIFQTFTVKQLILLSKDTKNAKIKILAYLKEIENKADFLKMILSLLAILSKPYWKTPKDQYYSETPLLYKEVEKNFNDYLLKSPYISSDLKIFFDKTVEQNKEIKKQLKKCGNADEDEKDHIFRSQIDFYRDVFPRLIELLELEIIKYCSDKYITENNSNSIFIFDDEIFNFLFNKTINEIIPCLSDAGNKDQEKMLKKIWKDFDNIQDEIRKSEIEIKDDYLNYNNNRNIDPRENLKKQYPKIIPLLNGLHKIENDKGEIYITDRDEEKTYFWQDTYTLLAALCMHWLDMDISGKKWKPFAEAFDIPKLFDNAKQYKKDMLNAKGHDINKEKCVEIEKKIKKLKN